MNSKKIFSKCVLVFLLFFFIYFGQFIEITAISSQEDKTLNIDRPIANVLGVNNLISEEFARNIVIIKAQDRWEKIAIGSPILCSDDNGKLVAYMFPIKINDDVFPDDQLLFKRNLHRNIQKLGFDWGTEEYWTFVISARTTDYPVPCEFNTLPPYYVTLFKAKEIAENKLTSSHVSLIRFYFLGHRGEYFELSDSNKSILIHAYRIEPFEVKQILIRKGETELDRSLKYQSLSQEDRIKFNIYQQKVREEWKRLRNKIEKLNK